MRTDFTNYIAALTAAVILSACQRGITYNPTPFQSKSSIELNKMVSALSAPVRAARSTTRGATVLKTANGMGGFDLYGLQPYQNRYFSNSPEEVINSCLSLLGVLNTTTSSTVFMSALIKCTNVVASRQNPAYAMTYNNLGASDQSKYWYTGAYAMPGVDYSTFVQNSYNYQPQYQQWAQYGDLPH